MYVVFVVPSDVEELIWLALSKLNGLFYEPVCQENWIPLAMETDGSSACLWQEMKWCVVNEGFNKFFMACLVIFERVVVLPMTSCFDCLLTVPLF